jgi:hypothetical protein
LIEKKSLPEVEWQVLPRSRPCEILLTATNDPPLSSIFTTKATTPSLPSLPTSQTPTNLSLTKIHNRTSSQKNPNETLTTTPASKKKSPESDENRQMLVPYSPKQRMPERERARNGRKPAGNRRIRRARTRKLYRFEEEPENRAGFRRKLNQNGRERDRKEASRFLEEGGRILREMKGPVWDCDFKKCDFKNSDFKKCDLKT